MASQAPPPRPVPEEDKSKAGDYTPSRVYNAIYSAVQVYECMIRGIAVMRRRVDSYVNATQILKVAGIDKGRRTKILEKEILPGKHEIVQGGYGKYQGTWIPLERGREVAIQFGVAPLLAPLFDYTPYRLQCHTLVSHIQPPAQFGSPLHFQSPSPQNFGPQGRPSPFLQHPYPSAPNSIAKSNLSRPQPSGSLTHPPSTYHYPGNANPYAMKSSSPHLATGSASLKRAREDAPQSTSTSQKETTEMRSQASMQKTKESTHTSDSVKPPPSKRSRTGDAPTLSPAPNKTSTGLAQPADPSTRFFTKGDPFSPNERLAPLKNSRYRAIVASISQDADPSIVMEFLQQSAESYGVMDVDISIDDLGHSALHWAAALARVALVEALIQAGADIHRGNDSGETPLIRAILSSSSFHTQSFPQILSLLSGSLRTVDASSRSVLHHIALVAGVKTRGPSARYYMECVLEYIARNEGGEKGLKSVVDLQDIHGDTALNLAARVGNRSIVRNLIDVGANKVLENKLGLRPGDFGVEEQSLNVPTAGDLLSALRTGPSAPAQKSKDVIADMTSMIQNLEADFAIEVKAKQDQLDVIQGQLRAATRELAEQRRQMQLWQATCAELDEVQQRIRNVQRAIRDEEEFDWGVSDSAESNMIGDRTRDTTTQVAGSMMEIDVMSSDSEPVVPPTNTLASLIQLRRLKTWHSQIESAMTDRLSKLKGASAEKEFQCKKIVSLCTGVAVENVEAMLENLVIAMESDGPVPELARVSGFMQKHVSASPMQPI
ncbi:hypothetical protein BS47DRAFT_1318135 [Hydnum rufescens UP504]|uniref:HTH APSES-type domain-containing protein n=1 Tax=Hydnum rufescens UP504 TaxID=1448309 RepID=A0A9P6AVF0_9AGAM|nr:hypothetical protein BS47DRAFT_1318135 [Hydnum rufescens UP504]